MGLIRMPTNKWAHVGPNPVIMAMHAGPNSEVPQKRRNASYGANMKMAT